MAGVAGAAAAYYVYLWYWQEPAPRKAAAVAAEPLPEELASTSDVPELADPAAQLEARMRQHLQKLQVRQHAARM